MVNSVFYKISKYTFDQAVKKKLNNFYKDKFNKTYTYNGIFLFHKDGTKVEVKDNPEDYINVINFIYSKLKKNHINANYIENPIEKYIDKKGIKDEFERYKMYTLLELCLFTDTIDESKLK